ncbi:TadE/TadG family type IV pilus assembly protein [Actibacterium ureilyticum]|uniref:TadE/TadG family type IV pilus assembly protein n=1 Tax=Actibacterium ureilyticum TaxID=1590614 RepID=UPI000BAAE05F|nr:hypothetical protein [Actibacterium ureilyticum]
MTNVFTRILRRFAKEEKGTLTVEAVMILPILVWWWVASLVFFDAYQALNVNQKAAYTVSDMISREMGDEPVNATYMDGMGAVFGYLTAGHGTNSAIRVTEIYCEDDCDLDNPNRVIRTDWSYSTDSRPALDDDTIVNFEDQIPIMTKQDRAIMVETFMDYTSAFNVGLDDGNYQNLVVTRLRFAPKLCWNACDENS